MKKLFLSMILLVVFCLTVNVCSETDRNKKTEAVKVKVAVGSAFYGDGDLKKALMNHLKEKGYEVKDFTPDDKKNKLDYPEIAHQVAGEISKGNYDRGILICGTGMGVSIVANKHASVYAALVENEYAARYSRIFNNSNVLCFGQFVTTPEKAIDILNIWLETEFADDPQWGQYCRETAIPQVIKIEGEVFKNKK